MGKYIRLAEVTNYDIIAMNIITPVFDDACNMGQYGRQYKNVHSKRAVVDVLATAGSSVVFGGLTMPDGTTDPWWRMSSGAMYLEGSRSIGTSLCNVTEVYAGNVIIGGQDAATKTYVT